MLCAVEKLTDDPPEENDRDAPVGSHLADAAVDADEEVTSEEAAFQDVLKRVTRGQTRALMIEYLAARLLEDFVAHGNDKPKMLLRLPNTGAFAADFDDVFELNTELLSMASGARARVQQLLQSRVSVPAEPPVSSTPRRRGGLAEGAVERTVTGPRRQQANYDEWSGLGDPGTRASGAK